jgi:hypothetical protein
VRFLVRSRIGVPARWSRPAALKSNHRRLGRELRRRAMAPSGTRGALNDALSIHFADATLANAFVVRWCVGAGAEATGGVFQVREDAEGRGGPAQYP